MNKLVKESEASFILSSAWRMFGLETFNIHAAMQSLAQPAIDQTPRLDGIRGQEIQSFLNKHKDVNKFVIIDDDTDMGDLLPFLVRTDMEKGFMEEHYVKALEMLK